MKISQLINQLKTLPDQEIVVQKNYDDGYYSLHNLVLFLNGHIGNNGPIIMIGEQINNDTNKTSN